MSLHLIGYTRVSTDEQAAYGYGLDAQESKLKEYARRANVDLTIIRDDGISDGLVVAKLDRLSRSVIDFALLLEWFTIADAQLVALDFDLDTSTPSGRLVAHIMAGVAEWERGVISLRTKEALAIRRQKGQPVGRPSVSAEVAARIRDMRDDGKTYQAICDELNAEGIPTARGAGEWRPSAIQAVLGYKRKPQMRKNPNLPDPRKKRTRTRR